MNLNERHDMNGLDKIELKHEIMTLVDGTGVSEEEGTDEQDPAGE